MYGIMALVPLSCDHFWAAKDFATYVEVLHKDVHGLCPFPYCFLKCLRKKNVALLFAYLFFPETVSEWSQIRTWA